MRKIIIEPLSRVEGEGGITIRLEKNAVKEVRFDIYEGVRLVETLLKGKDPVEALSIACRICAICSTSHRFAASRALESAMDIHVPPKVTLLRSLLQIGEFLESHSLHVFLLVLPDYFESGSAVSLAGQIPGDIRNALLLKKFATEMIENISGRKIHGENPTLGGFGKYPGDEVLRAISQASSGILPVAERGVQLLGSRSIPDILDEDTLFVCCDPDDENYGLFGNTIKTSEADRISPDLFKKTFRERIVPHSTAKHCYFNGRPFTVGALARLNILGERLRGLAGEYYHQYWNRRWLKNPLYNPLAQAIEMVWALEQIPLLADRIMDSDNPPDIVPPGRRDGEGTGLVEAPRGLLTHFYRIKDGLVSHADIITPTGFNLADCEKYLRKAAEGMLHQNARDEALRFQCEMIARAYDPCISCATHLVRIDQT